MGKKKLRKKFEIPVKTYIYHFSSTGKIERHKPIIRISFIKFIRYRFCHILKLMNRYDMHVILAYSRIGINIVCQHTCFRRLWKETGIKIYTEHKKLGKRPKRNYVYCNFRISGPFPHHEEGTKLNFRICMCLNFICTKNTDIVLLWSNRTLYPRVTLCVRNNIL